MIPLWVWVLAALSLLLVLASLQWLAAEAENASLRRERDYWRNRFWDLLAEQDGLLDDEPLPLRMPKLPKWRED